MVVVTGATGKMGQMVVEKLAEKMPADQIGICVRDGSKATVLANLGVRVRQGDFADPASLRHAFEGAEQILLISVDKLGETALQLHRAAIKAAYEAGAWRVLYTSHIGARAGSPFVPACDHAASEAFLAEAGVPFTSLRNGFYAESALHLIGHGFDAGEIRAPEDGPVSWTTRADLAEGAAIVLAEERVSQGRLNGITPPLTAPEAFTMADLAAIASELTGRTIKRVTLADDEWRQAVIAQGTPAHMAEMLLGMYQAARRGDFAAVDPMLEALLSRRPQTMRQVLMEMFHTRS